MVCLLGTETQCHLEVWEQYLVIYTQLIVDIMVVTRMLVVVVGAVILPLLPVLPMVPVRPIMLPATSVIASL